MYKRLSFIILCFSLCFAQSIAQADEAPTEELPKLPPKISLITISAGPTLMSAFGHMAIEVDEDNDDSTENVVFDFGDVNLDFRDSDHAESNALNFLNEHLNTFSRGKKASVFYAPYLTAMYGHRYISIDQLKFTRKQEDEFYLSLLLAHSRTLQGYEYKNFTNNCTTIIRDLIFSVLESKIRKKLEDSIDQISYESVVLESFDEAAQNNLRDGTLNIVPPELQGNPQLKMYLAMAPYFLGTSIPLDVKSGKELREAVVKIDTGLSRVLKGSDLAQAFHQFTMGEHLFKPTMTNYDSLFTPKRLREALSQVHNPETGETLIDASKTTTRESAFVHEYFIN